MFSSAASTNARTPAEETPWASGLLRGNSAARQMELLRTISASVARVFMTEPVKRDCNWGDLYRRIE